MQFYPKTLKKTLGLSLQSPLPKRRQWVALELNRNLMGSRSQLIQLTFRFLMAVCMAFYVPTSLTLAWLALTLLVNFRMTQLENAFSVLINAKPKILTVPMLSLVESYKKTWLANGLIWGIAPFLAITWLPRMNQIYCAIILLVLSMMSISRTHSDRKLMNQISTILVGSQILALSMNLGLVKPQNEDYYFYFFSVISLCFILGLLWFTGNLLNMLVRQYLNTVYSNISTIQKLKKAQSQRNDALQLLWHDLRAPQAAILTLLRTQGDEEVSSQTSRELFHQKISQQVRATLELADNFVWQLRAESDTYDYQEVDVVQLVHEVFEKAWPFAQAKNMTFSCDLSQLVEHQCDAHGIHDSGNIENQKTKNLWLKLEPRLMGRAIFNLIENAIKYSPMNASIVIVLRVVNAVPVNTDQHSKGEQQSTLEIIVKDEGYGILSNNIPRIFDPYTRFSSPSNASDTSISPATSGHGLGLRLVKTVVDMHRGLVRCHSVPNVGSTFTIELPL